jgi:hypothetical protein
MINIRRHLTGQAGRHKWPSDYVPFGVRCEINQLLSFAAGTIPDDDIRHKIISSTGLYPSHWLVTLPTVTTLNTQICLIRKAIQRRKRTEMRLRMQTAYLNRERARREMKYRQFISTLVGKQRTPFDIPRYASWMWKWIVTPPRSMTSSLSGFRAGSRQIAQFTRLYMKISAGRIFLMTDQPSTPC